MLELNGTYYKMVCGFGLFWIHEEMYFIEKRIWGYSGSFGREGNLFQKPLLVFIMAQLIMFVVNLGEIDRIYFSSVLHTDRLTDIL